MNHPTALHVIVNPSIAMRNYVLRSLPQHTLVEKAARSVYLEFHPSQKLADIRDEAPTTIFPLSGVISTVAHAGFRSMDVAYCGREGMAGGNPLLVSGQPRADIYGRSPGAALAVATALVADFIADCREARSLVAYAFHAQAMQLEQSVTAAALATIQQRLARWLLSYRSFTDRNEIDCTHDGVARMLGVRRSSVTDSLHRIEATGAIRSTRASIILLDRHKLSMIAGDFRPC